MAGTQHIVDVRQVKTGSHLHDAAQDRTATVAWLMEIVGAMPARISPGDGHAAAVVEFAEGLRAIADVLDPPEEP